VGALVAAGAYAANREGRTGAPSVGGSTSSSVGASSAGSGAEDAPDEVTVRITAEDGRSWVSAKASVGELLYDGLLQQGETKTFSAEESIDLVLGEAGALRLVVNGKKIGNDFTSVRRFRRRAVTRIAYPRISGGLCAVNSRLPLREDHEKLLGLSVLSENA
jgi:hypothetical protein